MASDPGLGPNTTPYGTGLYALAGNLSTVTKCFLRVWVSPDLPETRDEPESPSTATAPIVRQPPTSPGTAFSEKKNVIGTSRTSEISEEHAATDTIRALLILLD